MNHLLHRNTLVTGTVLLTAAGLLSRVIGFFYKIFLSRTIGAEGLGIYQLLFPVMALCFSLTSAGIQTAISKCVAEESGVPTPARARLYLYCGLLFSVSLSLLLGVFLWNYATWISAFFLGDLRCAPLLRILAFSYIPCSIHSCINGYYYGLKKSLVPSLSQLAEQCARVGGVYLIYLILQEKGMGITVSAAVWGIFFGEFAGMLVSLSAMGCGKWEGSISSSAKALLQMAFPVTANRLFLTFFRCGKSFDSKAAASLRLYAKGSSKHLWHPHWHGALGHSLSDRPDELGLRPAAPYHLAGEGIAQYRPHPQGSPRNCRMLSGAWAALHGHASALWLFHWKPDF